MTGRVFVTGATGVLGRPTVPILVGAGWRVTAVARSATAAAALDAVGARPVAVDLFDAAAVRDAVDGHDALVHLATSIPPMARMARRSAWAMNDRLRVDATRHLVDAARVCGITRVVKESVTFSYVDGGDAWLDESASVDAAGWPAVLAGEDLVTSFAGEGGRGVVLRFGLLYAAGARSTDELRRLARWRLAPVPGHPEAFVSLIRADDAATAVLAALTVAPGTYNVVDDRPQRRREYADTLARVLGTRRLHAVPAAPVRWIGGAAARGLVASQRVSNRAFVAAAGWQPRWTDAVDGWADALDGSASAPPAATAAETTREWVR